MSFNFPNIIALQQEKLRLDVEKNALQSRITTLDGINNILQGEKNGLQGDNSRLQGEKNALAQQISTSIQKISELNQQTSGLATQITTLKGEKSGLAAQITTLKGEIGTLSKQITTLEGEKSELNKLIAILEGEKATFDEQKRLLEEEIDMLESIISTLEEDKIELKEKNLKEKKYLDSSLNNLFSYLKTQNVNPDVLYEKVNYRDIEHQKIFNINKALDILFYSFYFSFLLIMICMGNVKREHFLIYLFVGLIPVVYPFVFKFGKLLVDYLSPPLHGPKNAFVDSHNTIYAYDI